MDNDEKTMLQEKFDKVKDLRPIDDVFFRGIGRGPLGMSGDSSNDSWR